MKTVAILIQVAGFLAVTVMFVYKAPDWAVAGALMLAMWLERDKLLAELRKGK